MNLYLSTFQHPTKRLEAEEPLVLDQYTAADQVTATRSGDGLARVPILGELVSGPSRLKFARSTDLISLTEVFQELADDQNVSRVLLEVNSGGGGSEGVEQAAEALRELAEVKPVYASVQFLCASAAYWITSQANRIYATRASRVGGIGVFTTVADTTGANQQQGIKLHVVRSGQFKGIGQGEVTSDHVAEKQAMVDELASIFVEEASNGRNRNLRSIADGRVYFAEKAARLGLIDAVGNTDQAIADLMAAKAPATLKERMAVEDKRLMGVFSYGPATAAEEYERHKAVHGEKTASLLPLTHAALNPTKTKFRPPVKTY